jgi:hypothetical protein
MGWTVQKCDAFRDPQFSEITSCQPWYRHGLGVSGLPSDEQTTNVCVLGLNLESKRVNYVTDVSGRVGG